MFGYPGGQFGLLLGAYRWLYSVLNGVKLLSTVSKSNDPLDSWAVTEGSYPNFGICSAPVSFKALLCFRMWNIRESTSFSYAKPSFIGFTKTSCGWVAMECIT